MDTEALAAEFALRKRSRLWETTEPQALAEWVVNGTVGLPEVAVVVWDDELSLILRIAGTPLDAGLKSGELSADHMRSHGIERLKNRYRTQAQDAARYQCDGWAAAHWFIGQEPVRQASRLMCARLVLDGRAPHVHNYDVGVVAESWAAAEVTVIGEPDGNRKGFDRPYRGRQGKSDYPAVMNVGAQGS